MATFLSDNLLIRIYKNNKWLYDFRINRWNKHQNNRTIDLIFYEDLKFPRTFHLSTILWISYREPLSVIELLHTSGLDYYKIKSGNLSHEPQESKLHQRFLFMKYMKFWDWNFIVFYSCVCPEIPHLDENKLVQVWNIAPHFYPSISRHVENSILEKIFLGVRYEIHIN